MSGHEFVRVRVERFRTGEDGRMRGLAEADRTFSITELSAMPREALAYAVWDLLAVIDATLAEDFR